MKHLDFILLDILVLQIAYIVAYVIRNGWRLPYENILYMAIGALLVLMDFTIAVLAESFKNILKRGYLREAGATIKHVVIVLLGVMAFLFITQTGGIISRLVIGLTATFHLLLSYGMRLLWKLHLQRRRKNAKNLGKLYVLTLADTAETSIKRLKDSIYREYELEGIILLDENRTGTEIAGLPVVADKESMMDFLCRNWVDAVYLDVPMLNEAYFRMSQDIMDMGITVHAKIVDAYDTDGYERTIESVGGNMVITTSIRFVKSRQAVVKRLVDIVAGLVGCLITLVLMVFIGPAIFIASPGPIFFKQERIGKNGKRFKMYKFRSMYLDAEERKAALMEQNRVKDAMMFKLDFDPRIIGAKKLPDGRVKRGIGNFIRDFSLDEFPQFFNVLKGDMSLIGTRPPTPDEWEKYLAHHRVRMSIKPGITGLWQVSGRSKIVDFEEVVKLDEQYIREWDYGLDLRILFATVKVVFKRDGAM